MAKKTPPAVPSFFFRPGLEQRGNRSSIVGHQRQSLCCCVLQTDGVRLSQEFAPFPFRHADSYQRAMAPAKTLRHRRRDMLVQKELEHFSSLMLLWKRIRRLEAACASGPQNLWLRSRKALFRFLPEMPLHN